MRACSSFAEDNLVDAFYLNIHLDSRNALFGTRNFEIHIPEEIFEALDVAKDVKLVVNIVLDEPHGYAGYGSP